MPLNPGIRRTVEWLNRHGFKTTDSGDGATHDHECDRDIAYVVISTKPAEMCNEVKRLAYLLAKAGIEVQPMNEDNSEPNIQGAFDACWDAAFIDLTNVKDSMLPEVLP